MQGWGGGDEWRVTANGDRVSFWGYGDILESGDGLHNIVNVQNAWIGHLKLSKWWIAQYTYFDTIKNKS